MAPAFLKAGASIRDLFSPSEKEAEVIVDGAPPSLVAACKLIIPFPSIINNRFAHPVRK
jgi:hypothetical protein